MAMPMMRTMMTATIPYMTVVFEARPLTGVGVGDGAGAFCTTALVLALDPQ